MKHTPPQMKTVKDVVTIDTENGDEFAQRTKELLQRGYVQGIDAQAFAAYDPTEHRWRTKYLSTLLLFETQAEEAPPRGGGLAEDEPAHRLVTDASPRASAVDAAMYG